MNDIHTYFPVDRRPWGAALPRTLGRAMDQAIARIAAAATSLTALTARVTLLETAHKAAGSVVGASGVIEKTGITIATYETVGFILVQPTSFPGKVPHFRAFLASGAGATVAARMAQLDGTPLAGSDVATVAPSVAIENLTSGPVTLGSGGEGLYQVQVSGTLAETIDLYLAQLVWADT